MVRRKRVGLCKGIDACLCTIFLGMKLPRRSEAPDNTLNDIKRMLNSLHVLICKLMSPRDVSGSDIDLHVKYFFPVVIDFRRGIMAMMLNHFGLGREISWGC